MSGTEPSGLDHLYTNWPEHMSDVQVHFKGSSDHRMVSVTRFTKSVIRKTRLIRRRSFKHFDPGNFLKELSKVSWLELYLSEDVNKAVQIFTDKITAILDRMAPV